MCGFNQFNITAFDDCFKMTVTCHYGREFYHIQSKIGSNFENKTVANKNKRFIIFKMSYYYHTPEPRNTDGALDAFVGDFPYGPIWVVNIILYIIARCKSRKVHPRVWYLIFSLFKNIIIGLFPTGLINIIYKSSRIEILITSIALLGFFGVCDVWFC